jgi:uncharacterized cupin superfamily protein
MKPLLLNHPLPELMNIGSVSNLGSTIIDGDPQAGVAMIYGQPGDNLTCGLFSCTRGVFRMEYPFAEHATVLEGSVRLTNERTGDSVEYQQGDSWFVEKNTPVHWEITSDRFVKHYLAVVEA